MDWTCPTKLSKWVNWNAHKNSVKITRGKNYITHTTSQIEDQNIKNIELNNTTNCQNTKEKYKNNMIPQIYINITAELWNWIWLTTAASQMLKTSNQNSIGKIQK